MQFQIPHPWQVTSLTCVPKSVWELPENWGLGWEKLGINCSMLWARTCKNQRTFSNLLFHIQTRSEHWQVYFKVLHKSLPHLDDQTLPQGRTEVNLISFPDELLVEVVASFGDADAADSHFSDISKALLLTSPLLELLQTWSCRHQPGTAWGRVWRRIWISPSHPLPSGNTSQNLWKQSKSDAWIYGLKELHWSGQNWRDQCSTGLFQDNLLKIQHGKTMHPCTRLFRGELVVL